MYYDGHGRFATSLRRGFRDHEVPGGQGLPKGAVLEGAVCRGDERHDGDVLACLRFTTQRKGEKVATAKAGSDWNDRAKREPAERRRKL
jgi:hypothetical protein